MLVCWGHDNIFSIIDLIDLNVKSVGIFEVKETSNLSSEIQQLHYCLASKKFKDMAAHETNLTLFCKPIYINYLQFNLT